MNKYLEMRSICLIEPETEEFVQVTYLCDLDSNMYEDEILNTCGGLRNVGMATRNSWLSAFIQYLYTMKRKGRPCGHGRIQ